MFEIKKPVLLTPAFCFKNGWDYNLKSTSCMLYFPLFS